MAKTADLHGRRPRLRGVRYHCALLIASMLTVLASHAIAADGFQMPSASGTGAPLTPNQLAQPSAAASRAKSVGQLRPAEYRGEAVAPQLPPQPKPAAKSPPVQQIHTAPRQTVIVGNRVTQASAQSPAPIVPLPPVPEITAPADPPRPVEISIPITGGAVPGKIDLTMKDDRISLMVRDAPLTTVLGVLAQQHGLNIVTAANVTGNVTLTLTDVSLDAGLNAILRTNGYTWTRQDNIIVVTQIGAAGASAMSPLVQGREMRVFNLNFLAATDADSVVKGLLSPVGKSIISQSDPLDKRKTRDQLVVEDLPEYIHRIEQYFAQADRAPRQVLIEAHVLQIALKDETKHGVDIKNLLARVDGADVTFKSQGLANPLATPAYFFGIDGTDLDVLVELIKQTTDSKTLAAPKVMVVNGQEAHMQAGSRIGYNTTTTTQTSTMQQVSFLDVGVILRVTPTITDDNQILMKVRPEVSDGSINPTTSLPQSNTTEVETTVMLNDGRGMVIGGMIKEEDTESQAKLPIAGDLWLVGRLFQRRVYTHSRNEIIVCLVPRLVPLNCPAQAKEDVDILRATSPILGPHLERVDRRPVEPELPDAIRNPRVPAIRRFPDFFRSLHRPYPNPRKYYYPSADGDVTLKGLHPRDPGIVDGPQPGAEVVPGDAYCPPMEPTRPN